MATSPTCWPNPVPGLPFVANILNVVMVPDVGRVMLVLPPVARATVWVDDPMVVAPDVLRFPPMVMVLPVLATPVPPYWPAMTLPCHVPMPMVPMEDSDDKVVTPLLTKVPLVGRVTLVVPVAVRVVL